MIILSRHRLFVQLLKFFPSSIHDALNLSSIAFREAILVIMSVSVLQGRKK
jgi:hypothetical protein